MTLADLLALFQAGRTGPAVPMSAGGVPLGNRPLSLQERVNGARIPSQNASPIAPPWIGVRS